MGEMAFAKATDHYGGLTVNAFRKPDIAGYQVRTRSGLVKGPYVCDQLNIRDADKDDDIFVLVVGHDGVYEVRGWLRAGDAKRAEWSDDKGNRGAPCYWVPHEALHPMSELEEA